ncbi:hypothetical protein [Alicyclobacillus mengziensis]|uniref:Uncharacterized protein n=1 Tax=Alicyclobacillus mengziensis TaxID=2931921 RepID=A0A9X7VZL9_9BACL|nr:hypothetical protein [Alicyclobacillus mengziensis]QSO46643.1 hypothetical protein JZ786_19660 [Alicyclobacillus mengziensis]
MGYMPVHVQCLFATIVIAISHRLRDVDEWAGTISLLDAERRIAKTLLLFMAKTSSGTPTQPPISNAVWRH